MNELFRTNNYNLIRLIAALQVVVFHALSHWKVDESSFVTLSVLRLFPGVPIFFFVSGFLISKSYENNSVIKQYAQNRILRIYPALIVCTFISVLSVYLTGYLSSLNLSFSELTVWIVGQISIFQFYNPDFMRDFGTGVLNGSLWTISVELQFYIVMPILYWMLSLSKSSKRNTKIVLLILFFMIFHFVRSYFLEDYSETVLFKVFNISFLPWIYMFLVGVLFQQNFSMFHRILSNKAVFVLPVYLMVSYIAVDSFGWRMGNEIKPSLFFFLAVLIFSLAYSYSALSKKILRGNDVSYGIYIYHIPVVNLLMYYGYSRNFFCFYMVIAATILMALASWFFIEKNSIKLKTHPLNPLKAANTVI